MTRRCAVGYGATRPPAAPGLAADPGAGAALTRTCPGTGQPASSAGRFLRTEESALAKLVVRDAVGREVRHRRSGRNTDAMRIRRATLEDVPAIAALHVDGWRSFRTFLPEAVWGTRTLQRRLREWPKALGEREVLLAEEQGRLLGFISTRRHGREGEFSTFFVASGSRGRGIGHQLLAAAASRLAEQGAARIVVRTFAEGRACVLFERLGGVVIDTTVRDYGGADVVEVTYEWPAGALERMATRTTLPRAR